MVYHGEKGIHMVSVAIVGCPNVGKSTLFNRLLGKKRAIVYDKPGVTRDWQRYLLSLGPYEIALYDTPGIFQDQAPIRWEIPPVDLVFWVIDGKAAIDSHQKALRQKIYTWIGEQEKLSGKSIPLVAIMNKTENPKEALEALSSGYALGVQDVLSISALHGHGIDELKDYLQKIAAQQGPQETPPLSGGPSLPLVVVIGKPNVGKSTLLNKWLGYTRVQTSPERGTTRDSIQVETQWKGQPFHLVDTAGMAKKTHEEVEKHACSESYRALVFCQVAIVMVDAVQGVEKQDLSLMEAVHFEGRALVVALNKWDLVKNPKAVLGDLPVFVKDPVPISCKTGWGLEELFRKVFQEYAAWNRRISTGKLNRWLKGQLQRHAPPASRSHPITVKYITQTKSRPPTFKLFGNNVHLLSEGYKRYLSAGLTRDFGLSAVTITYIVNKNPYQKG